MVTSSRPSGSAVPLKRIARYIDGQVSETAIPLLAAISWPLADSMFVTNPGPRSSKKRISTVRTFGSPYASTVATESASGSGTSARVCARSTASETQRCACWKGVGATSASDSPSPM